MLSVEDDGRGISLADRCRLFQPFFTTKPHGTGLGLFVSRQILEEFSGDAELLLRAGTGLHVHRSGFPGKPRGRPTVRMSDGDRAGLVRLPTRGAGADGRGSPLPPCVGVRRLAVDRYHAQGMLLNMESRLPMSLASLTANRVARGSATAARGRILIVDDEEVIASTLKEFLQGEAVRGRDGHEHARGARARSNRSSRTSCCATCSFPAATA